jgi:F-type H+-transporting ATPase subunit gamma
MAKTQALSRHIRSVRNAKQITKALELVAAGRMRRIQSSVVTAREYAQIATAIMRKVAPSQEAQHHPYFKKPEKPSSLYIIFTSDHGQAGAFNSNVFHTAIKLFSQDRNQGVQPSVVVFGNKGANFFAKLEYLRLLGEYEEVADVPATEIFAPVLTTIAHGIENDDFNSVTIIYTGFVSSMTQHVQTELLLPVTLPEIDDAQAKEKADKTVYEFEPSLELVLDEALRLYFESQLLQARIESAASEYAMRMMAMGNASRNADDLIDNLTLELNATRQAVITQEIAEITGGAVAIGA